MKSTLNTDNQSSEIRSLEVDESKSVWPRAVAILLALGLTAAVLFGYMLLRRRHAERLRSEQPPQAQPAKPSPSPVIQAFIDEAMIKGSQALIGGTLHNISTERLSDLRVEIELKRRKDGSSEIRTLPVEPNSLAPDGQGRYSLTISSKEYRESRLLHIKSGASAEMVAFKNAPGAQRPPERPQTGKTIVIKPSPKKGNGEEFINTPDSPIAVP